MHRKTVRPFAGSLLGGAVGDALGAPVEFMTRHQIQEEFGLRGVIDYHRAYGRIGAITDDTQMTLFTAEGLILSQVRKEYHGPGMISTSVYHAYLRWLMTQETDLKNSLIKSFGTCAMVDGFLTGHAELFSRRSPGNSCLYSLKTGKMGTITEPINTSKGCGGVMRMAPVGLFCKDAAQAFRLGCECAAITHGHPSGYLAAGFLAALICRVSTGKTLMYAVEESTQLLKERTHHEEVFKAVSQAISLYQTSTASIEAVSRLGQGWVAEEALAIGLYCALAAGSDFAKGVTMAVNHDGDSDSTGAITGNIIGALYGKKSIPDHWLDRLELKAVIEEVAEDLCNYSEHD